MTENIRHIFAAGILSSFLVVYSRIAGPVIDTLLELGVEIYFYQETYFWKIAQGLHQFSQGPSAIL